MSEKHTWQKSRRWRPYLCIVLSYFTCAKVAGAVVPVLQGMKSHWTDSSRQGSRSQTRDMRWADSAFSFLHNLDCEHVIFATHKECQRLSTLPKHEVTVYLAPVSSYGRYLATLPDERLSHGQTYDAVLVLDPYPKVSFGHLVLIFFVDTGISRLLCHRKGGIYLENEECMHLAVRKRCKNFLERKSRRRNFSKRCEISFLPTVHLDSDRYDMKNYLECQADLTGFHDCPQLTDLNITSKLLCDSHQENSIICSRLPETIRGSCKVFEICDQGVLLSGGWNRLTMDISYKKNLVRMYQLLRNNGFKRRNIHVFSGNGIEDLEIADESVKSAYPATMKFAFRYHIQKLCSSLHCVDSLLMYLNSPAMHDGSTLLWDINGDGMAAESEKYTVEELLADTVDCSAKHVQMIVDQSYSGEVVQAVKNSVNHGNVVVFSSGKSNEYSHNNELSLLWANQNDSRACTTDIFKNISASIESSTPLMANTENIRTTLSGAPCNVDPPFSIRELRQDYFGCQNLPTAVWLRDMQHGSIS